ncbi:hypothetical protein PILCRDRAFT_821095 [Piloderma croceum F 1598]|uniref:Transmembrane protein n=1 Tax=Piloderma croceum (strain F 1598) TaxID=765440 RepID=A0A0C3BWK9_PILCF|nr:hypothetical protein PILCRDRAFT_821095 [Piloderma croceum F 1598]
MSIPTILYLLVGALAFFPVTSANNCNDDDPFNNDNCGFHISSGVAFGIAVAVFAVIVAITSFFTIRRRRRAQQANLAYIRNAQAQQGNVYQGHLPSYQPNYPAYSPGPVPNQQTYYPPPPGPPPINDTKGQGHLEYDPTNAPQFPPPTYNSV